MLVRLDDDDGAIAIGQLSHAWLSGQLARAWGNAAFPAPDPREEIALGAEQHDIGWARVDVDPPFNPETGRPRNFLELTVEEHLGIWQDAPEHLMSQSLHAALVVSLHGRSLSELRANASPDQAEALRGHIAAERERQERLRELLGLAHADLERTQRQMWTWDGISLALCNGWRPFTARDVPSSDGLTDVELRDLRDGSLALDPWPLSSERVELRCEARRIATSYESESAMRHALARCRPVTLTFTLAAP